MGFEKAEPMEKSHLELNIVSIIIGVLLARIIYIWILAFKGYVESIETYDRDIHDTDEANVKKMFVSALVSTGISGIIIIIVLQIYAR